MSFRRISWLALLTATFFLQALAAAAAPKSVMVYYMPWFVAKPFSSSWGWHWTMNHYDPDVVNAFGERQVASWYYPLIGPYDSADPVVLEYHVLLMKLAGVDGVIVSNTTVQRPEGLVSRASSAPESQLAFEGLT